MLLEHRWQVKRRLRPKHQPTTTETAERAENAIQPFSARSVVQMSKGSGKIHRYFIIVFYFAVYLQWI
jgi:hypothetical protein